jgi:hypothetical protein
MLAGPIESLDRYIKVLGYHNNPNVRKMTLDISKFQLVDAKFLKYKPSQIVACSLILAINIWEKESEKYSDNAEFFSLCRQIYNPNKVI